MKPPNISAVSPININEAFDDYSEPRDATGLSELSDDDPDEIAYLQSVLSHCYFEPSSYEGITTTAEKSLDSNDKILEEALAKAKNVDDPVTSDIRAVLLKYNIFKQQQPILDDLVNIVRKNISFYENPADPVLKNIDTSTPLSYWKKQCPELFDYPERMHGFKTSWDLLKGIYNPKKHKTLYYNDLKAINNKLYRAVYRRNSKENFLPTHSDRVTEELSKMKNKKIKLSDINDPKAKERFRMRYNQRK